jgi:poly(3-hydroxybutyrate) depolymerase
MLTWSLLCGPHPRLVAAVEINGSLESPCPEGTELPDVLSVHGADDGSIGLTQPVFVNHLGMAPRPVSSTLDTVAATAGCSARTTRSVNGVELWRYDRCRGGGRVDVHVVPDAGHGWADVGGAARAVAWLLPRLAAR